VKLATGNGEAKLANVFDDGPAQAAGLSAGDVLLAFDGLRVTAASFEAQLARRRPGDRLEVHAFRRDELMRFELELASVPADTVKLALAAKPAAAALALRKGWLGA
jgi:predicted metalloprotease with PDZ domain